MNIIRLYDRNDLRLEDKPGPDQQTGMLRLKTASVGICGSDKGQLVAVDPVIPCGRCEYCLEGKPNFHTSLAFTGSEDMDGGLQAYMNWPKSLLLPLPENFTPQEGAMPESLGSHSMPCVWGRSSQGWM
ncbi:MAG: alcohol dehydrogenase catalytic domain-containing protein [Chloroflexota bacterium]|nr:alcohol dehydrogenase catalytic domain-containing protein [Chloroflexota bacterium]